MSYSNVFISSLGYELPPVVVTSEELEERLEPMYSALHLKPGHLESLTGIRERRWWDDGYSLTDGATAAARKALEQSPIDARQIEVLIYAGVCREQFEPATACAVAERLGISPDAYVYDVSNACLGVLNGVIDIANRIELGQVSAGMVVSCESSREIIEIAIERMRNDPNMKVFAESVATLTGGSGAAAVLLTSRSVAASDARRLVGAVSQSAPEHHRLCRWGVKRSPLEHARLVLQPERMIKALDQLMEPATIPAALKELMTSDKLPSTVSRLLPSEKLPAALTQFMSTDSVAVLKHGVELGVRTWGAFLSKLGWARDDVDKIICHQVGSGHRDAILKELGIPPEKEYSTYKYLGNMGTVSLPLTAAVAHQRNFLREGDRVGFLGIGSGLNCLMVGWQW